MREKIKIEPDTKGLLRNKRCVPIEQLLGWAYRDQMVHRALRAPIKFNASRPSLAKSSIWSTGAPIESSLEQGLRAAEDAWIVHDEVVKLGEVVVDCGHDLAAARYHGLSAYRGAEPPLGHFGDLDQSARPWPTDGLLKIDLPVMVAIHASKLTRPGFASLQELRMERGETFWHPKRRTKVYSKGWFSHVTPQGDLPGDIAAIVATYRAWWSALNELRQRLNSVCFTMFSVTEDMPPTVEEQAQKLQLKTGAMR